MDESQSALRKADGDRCISCPRAGYTLQLSPENPRPDIGEQLEKDAVHEADQQDRQLVLLQSSLSTLDYSKLIYWL